MESSGFSLPVGHRYLQTVRCDCRGRCNVLDQILQVPPYFSPDSSLEVLRAAHLVVYKKHAADSAKEKLEQVGSVTISDD